MICNKCHKYTDVRKYKGDFFKCMCGNVVLKWADLPNGLYYNQFQECEHTSRPWQPWELAEPGRYAKNEYDT